MQRVVSGFVWANYWAHGSKWAESVFKMGWEDKELASFLGLLPFESEVWEKVAAWLGEERDSLYWMNVRIKPYGQERDLTVAIEKLLQYERAGSAVVCAAQTTKDASRFNEALAVDALLAVLQSESGIEEVDDYQTVELIKHLQKSETVDQDRLFEIEWGFLPWLDRHSGGSPTTLENRLSKDPHFFAEVISLVFRSKDDTEERAEELSDRQRELARKAYNLLTCWRRCPGVSDDNIFSAEAFSTWASEARRITEERGYKEIGQSQIGHILVNAPPDPDGLWIHKAVASLLSERDAGDIRSGFTNELFNKRGVFTFTGGSAEREIASGYRKDAEALEENHFSRFATEMRALADQFERQAERDESRDPFED